MECNFKSLKDKYAELNLILFESKNLLRNLVNVNKNKKYNKGTLKYGK